MFPKCDDPQFFVKGGGAFADRQKSIFDQLDAAEKEQSARNQINNVAPPPRVQHLPIEVEPDNSLVRSDRRKRYETKQFRGKESIFKRPDAVPPRFKAKSIPDYHKNPHKWVKYSLGDVTQADMSNTSNTAAAFSFLQEIAARKASESMDDMSVGDSTPVFRNPRRPPTFGTAVVAADSTQTVDEKPFKSSKLVMPEYVVGLSKRKQRKREFGGKLAASSSLNTAVNLANIDGGLLVPFSWPTAKAVFTLGAPVDPAEYVGNTAAIKSDVAQPDGGEKPTVSKNKRRQRKKELKSKVNEIPLGHLMDFEGEEAEDGEEGGST